MKSATEIHAYVLAHLQRALFRPSMYGGELAVLQFFQHLAFIEQREHELQELRRELRQSGTFNSRGVTGAFEFLFGFLRKDAYIGQVVSVYARLAFAMGYLSETSTDYVSRLLSEEAFASLLNQVEQPNHFDTCDPDGLIERCGEPSIRWGRHDSYPCILLYINPQAPQQYIYFDFWAQWYKNEHGEHVPGKYGPKPRLSNIRIPAARFSEEFIWTPFGQELLKDGRALRNGNRLNRES